MKGPVLVVDDNPDNLKLAQLTLKLAGWEVHLALSGAEALRLLGEVGPTVVLTDLQMPGMDGFELTRRIRAAAPDVPVVALTAMVTEGRKARAAGCSGYITKPIDTRTFAEQVEGFLGV